MKSKFIQIYSTIARFKIFFTPMPSKSKKGFDRFRVQKIYQDADHSKAVYQSEHGWTERYSQHGFGSIPVVTIWRKTFQFDVDGFLNQEVTIYLNLPKLKSEYYEHRPVIGPCASGSGLSIKLRGGGHSDNGDGSARCYIFHFEYEGNNNCKNFQKEAPHPSMQNTPSPLILMPKTGWTQINGLDLRQ
jgi:hypothetical protein